MIPVLPADEPKTFNSKIRKPGELAIAEMVGERPKRSSGKPFKTRAKRRDELSSTDFPPYWRRCINDMISKYAEVCSYACFRIHPVTGAASVDHMAPKSRRWDKVYEWSNYRLCCSRMNARKNSFEDVVDPFEVEDDWFQLELVGFEVMANPKLSREKRDVLDKTIKRLNLNSFRKDRETDAENYWSGDISLKILIRESPFVANELKRQGRLLPRDTPAD